MRISDWSSDVCSSDLQGAGGGLAAEAGLEQCAAEKIEVARLRAAHRCTQSEAGDIGVAPSGHELDAAVEEFLFGIEHIENIASAAAVLGTDAFQRELVGSYSSQTGKTSCGGRVAP